MSTFLRAVALPLALGTIMSVACAQQRYTSPPASSSVMIDGKLIKIDYYAPSTHGRKIFNALVPYNRVWATGANVTTSITSEADLQFGNLKLPKGGYSIWSVPDEKQWIIIFNSATGSFHLNHDQSTDVGQVTVTPKTIPEMVDTLNITPVATGGDKGAVVIRWENTEVSIPFTVLP